VSRRTYLLISLLGAVAPIGVAALVTTSPWEPWLWWGALGVYLGVLGWLRPIGRYDLKLWIGSLRESATYPPA
jgi:hypothetical protein